MYVFLCFTLLIAVHNCSAMSKLCDTPQCMCDQLTATITCNGGTVDLKGLSDDPLWDHLNILDTQSCDLTVKSQTSTQSAEFDTFDFDEPPVTKYDEKKSTGRKSLSAIHREKQKVKQQPLQSDESSGKEEPTELTITTEGEENQTEDMNGAQSLMQENDGLNDTKDVNWTSTRTVFISKQSPEIYEESKTSDEPLRSALNNVLDDIFKTGADQNHNQQEHQPSVTRVQFKLRDKLRDSSDSEVESRQQNYSNPVSPTSPGSKDTPKAVDRESLLNSQQRILAQVRKVRNSTTPPTSPIYRFPAASPQSTLSSSNSSISTERVVFTHKTEVNLSPRSNSEDIPSSPTCDSISLVDDFPLKSILKKKSPPISSTEMEINRNVKPKQFHLQNWENPCSVNLDPIISNNPKEGEIIETINSARFILDSKANDFSGHRVSPFTNGQNGHGTVKNGSVDHTNNINGKMINLEPERSPLPSDIVHKNSNNNITVELPHRMSTMKVKVGEDESETIYHEDAPSCRDWNPTSLIKELYSVEYKARSEVKKSRFVNMEGHLDHLPMGVKSAAVESSWKSHYFKTKDGRLFWYQTPYAEEIALGEILLAGTDISMNKEECTLTICGGREPGLLALRSPSNLLDKWRQSLLSHAACSLVDSYVQPVQSQTPHYEKVVIVELGSCSIRAGLLTSEPSLPQVFFPSIAAVHKDGQVTVGSAALAPALRQQSQIVFPIKPTEPGVNRYSINLDIVKHIFIKVFNELGVKPNQYKVLVSVPQNLCSASVSDLMRLLVNDLGVQSALPMKQPSLTLFAYDVTTGVIVDLGNRLNIVPIIDGYVVQNAIVSLPLGSPDITDAFQRKLTESNVGVYGFQSLTEKFILRYLLEKTSYMATNYDEEVKNYHLSGKKSTVSIKQFETTPQMMSEFSVDSAAFTAPEGLIVPKLWGQDRVGLPKLIFQAIQASPMDNRRALYRNIYLCGGGTLLPGLAERLENELAQLVAPSIHIQVHMSPWRYHTAYLGAQVVAAGPQFHQSAISTETLEPFLTKLRSSSL